MDTNSTMYFHCMHLVYMCAHALLIHPVVLV